MPEIPEAPLARVRFWTCLNKEHRYVTWSGNVATCDTCGLTSEMTERHARSVARYIAAQILRRRCASPDLCEQCECRHEDASLARTAWESRTEPRSNVTEKGPDQ